MAFSMMGAMGDYMAEKTREIVKIDLENIQDDEKNDFEVEGSTEIETKNALLKDSIEQFGLLDPCVVRPAGGGKYTLISGHRRKLMHERLAAEGKDQFRRVDCVIIDANDDDAEQMLIEANIPNREISDWEKLQAVNRMNALFERKQNTGEKIPGRRREHIAAVLGMSTSAVGRMEKIEKNLTEEYKQELKEGNIGVSVADKIASKPKEEQKAIHATKGAKVKLVDLQETKPLPKETKTRLQGIPETAGEIIVVIGEYDGRFYAGYYGKAIGPNGFVHAFEYINKHQKYISREAAWDGAMDMITRDAWSNDLLKLKDSSPKPIKPQEKPAVDNLWGKSRAYGIAADVMEKARGEIYERQSAAIDSGNEKAVECFQTAINYLNEMIIKTQLLAQDAEEGKHDSDNDV